MFKNSTENIYSSLKLLSTDDINDFKTYAFLFQYKLHQRVDNSK